MNSSTLAPSPVPASDFDRSGSENSFTITSDLFRIPSLSNRSHHLRKSLKKKMNEVAAEIEVRSTSPLFNTNQTSHHVGQIQNPQHACNNNNNSNNFATSQESVQQGFG